jgi:hypothetical protein
MAKVAIQSALPGDKVLNVVVVRTIGDINKTVGDISSTVEIHRETRNNAVYAAVVLNNLQSWQQKVDARLDELHNVALVFSKNSVGCSTSSAPSRHRPMG